MAENEPQSLKELVIEILFLRFKDGVLPVQRLCGIW
jgi:hypothetical protein